MRLAPLALLAWVLTGCAARRSTPSAPPPAAVAAPAPDPVCVTNASRLRVEVRRGETVHTPAGVDVAFESTGHDDHEGWFEDWLALRFARDGVVEPRVTDLRRARVATAVLGVCWQLVSVDTSRVVLELLPMDDAATTPASAIRWVLGVEAPAGEALQVRWRGFYDPDGDVGRLFAILDVTGYRALVRTGRASDCDDCVGPRVAIELVSGNLRGVRDAIAIGPVRGALPRARATFRPEPEEPPKEWLPTSELDLDGDGVTDLESVMSCGGFLPGRRGGKVCREHCWAVRDRSGSIGTSNHCRGFIPDFDPYPEGP